MTLTFTDAELQQLLGRPARAAVDETTRRALRGRHVLVTGAGGSIGSELAREIAASDPGTLALVDHSEPALFEIERELRERWPALRLEVALADVTRGAAIARVCRDVQPAVVYHAAAYKHVTMAERAPAAAALVNVIGTVETAAASARVGARFVLISSDKAADPESVMGATKRVAELAVLAMAAPTFRPIVVRFGNVLGSSGSVLPIMRDSVRRGRPLPITDPLATRFFMTASEAVALVLKADMLGRAAEIFWLEMGRPIAMGTLAERLLALEEAAGFARVPLEIIGLRAGEKRDEILADPGLDFERTIDRRIRVARQPALTAVIDRPGMGRRVDARGRVRTLVDRLRRASLRANDLGVLEALSSMPGGFRPSALALELARRPSIEPGRKGRAA